MAGFALFAMLVGACAVDSEQDIEPEEPRVETKNPFTVENVAQAFENVAARARTSGRTEFCWECMPPSTTHNYVRFEPQNLNQIMRLHNLGYELWDEPLDQEIEFDGHYYQQPGLPDSLNYFYTLIPANYFITQEVPRTILSQVVLFDENAGDEQDPAEDPWIPNPDNCPDPLNPNCPCIEGPCARTAVDVREDLVKKTTKELLRAGVNVVELYNEMMKLAGYPGDVIEYTARGRTTNFRPAGCITVTDNSVSSATLVPVKNVEVKMKRWFKLDRVLTNDAGCFTGTKDFRRMAKVFLIFKNNSGVVRGINGALLLHQAFGRWQEIYLWL